MNAAQVIQRAHDAGILLRAVGDQIGCSPPDRMTPDLLRGLKEHKAEIIARLKEPWAPEQWDVFCGLVAILETHPHLWPALRGYARRELTPGLYEALDMEASR